MNQPSSIATVSNGDNYQKLKQILSLGLRRQVMFAVCDNLWERDRLIQQLGTDLNGPLPSVAGALVTIEINHHQPNFLKQIAQWLRQQEFREFPPGITFQVVGIEQFTREPGPVQWNFLQGLKQIAAYFPRLDFNVLIWLPRPWSNQIARSVPDFWQWHTVLLEFMGEPTPIAPLGTVTNPEVKTSFMGELQSAAVAYPWPLDGEISDRPEGLEMPSETEETLAPDGEPSPADDPPPLETTFSFQPHQDPPDSPPITEKPPAEPPTDPGISAETAEDFADYPDKENQLLEQAHRYRHRISLGAFDFQTLVEAIAVYQELLMTVSPQYPHRADFLNDLGNFYWMWGKHDPNPQQSFEQLSLAIESYQLALKLIDDQKNPGLVIMVKSNLGAVYCDLSRTAVAPERSPEFLEQAIGCYQEVLARRPLDQDPLKYAATENNLGTAYWYFSQDATLDPSQAHEYLHQAIACYEAAVEVYEVQGQFGDWAMLKNNLGTAYWNLSQGPDVTPELAQSHLLQAIACYEGALPHRPAQTLPQGHAATQNNLASAYWALSHFHQSQPHQWQQDLQRAITAYTLAIEVTETLQRTHPDGEEPLNLNFNLLATKHHLGLVYYQLGSAPHSPLTAPQQIQVLLAALKWFVEIHGQQPPEEKAHSFQDILKTIKQCHEQGGVVAQNQAIALIPQELLSRVLSQL